MLSLHKLEIFLAVTQEGKMNRAAERLLMTQAAISQHIHDLETSLGVSLFDRHPQGVRLTAEGETLLGYAKDIVWTIAAAEHALTQVKNLSDGKMEIGFTPSAASLLAPDWLRHFREQYPAIKVTAQTGITPSLVQALQEKQIDLAFVEGELEENPRLHVAELQQAQIFVVVPSAHPWAERASVSMQELASEPYISRQGGSQTHSWTMEIFSRFGFIPNIVAEFDNPHAIQRAIMQGMGVSLLPACFAQEEQSQGRLKLLTLQELPDLHRTLKAIWRSDLPLKPIPRAFLQMLAERYPHLQIPPSQSAPPR